MSIVAALLLSVPSAANAQQAKKASAPVLNNVPEMQVVLELGRQLYHYDQAAWHSTDLLKEKVKRLEELALKGRIVVPVDNGWQAIYYGEKSDGRFVIFKAVWNGKKMVDPVFYPKESGPLLSERENTFAAVFDILTKEKGRLGDIWLCNKAPPNFVILPGATSSEFSWYFMTSQTDINSFPLGGHHRLDIANGKVIASRSFSKSCLDMPRPKDVDKVEAFVVSHLLDPMPTEIHVFTAIASKVPIAVVTAENKKTWFITPSGGAATATVEAGR